MSDKDSVTRCPNSETSSKVTEVQSVPDGAHYLGDSQYNEQHEVSASESDSSPIQGFEGEIEVHDEDPTAIVGEYQPKEKRNLLLWSCLTVIAVSILTLQFVWLNRDLLSQDVLLRKYYLPACQLLNCTFADFSDIDGLSATDLVVRSHPQVDRSLIVDAIVTNSSSYRQRFPNLQLKFTDVNGRVLAARVFTPLEYLGGELTGVRYIPASTEVRLSLEVVDPGTDAVGYSLAVLEH